MNEENILIIAGGRDKTKEVEYFTEVNNEKIDVKFYNQDKIYSYKPKNIIIRKKAEKIDIEDKEIYYKGQLLFNVEKAIKFEELVKIIYKNGESDVFKYNEMSFKPKADNEVNKNIIEYFREIAPHVKDDDEEDDEKDSFLKQEYDKLNYIKPESVLNYYLNKTDLESQEVDVDNIIYPFRFNLSQKEALENVFKNKISVIQGPPGTGKTQTILNIVANLAIMKNKTVAVVSNNNEAVKNVKEKLDKSGYGFIVANLGKSAKRQAFFEQLPQPEVGDFYIDDEKEILLSRIKELNYILDELLIKNNNKAKLEKEIEGYKLEQKYFEEYYKKQDIDKINELSFYNMTEDRILEFMADSQMLCEGKIKFELLYKIKMLFKYRIRKLKELDKCLMDGVLSFQREFYKIKIKNLEKEYLALSNYLKTNDFEKLQKEHQDISNKIFKKELFQRYSGKCNEFELKNYNKDMKKFIEAFPVVLSTTFSLRNCIAEDFLFDYVIIDEASQVDLLAGCLALSCAQNAIIVGDEKQLPQIVDRRIKEQISSKEVDICYDYFENSILSAILRTYKDKIPQKTLKEHYRCHPKIIEFCNKRYYNGELIAFSNKEHLKVEKPLVLYYTAEGSHMRKLTRGEARGTFNERELEVIRDEVLGDYRVNKYSNNDIGVTTPYRMQADNIQKAVADNIESDTIHKFQGREKKLMILSTVLDSSYKGRAGIVFVDDPCKVNVAVSRAIEQFVLVTDNKLFNENGNEVNSLLKYIKYNDMDSEIVQSQIVSVFDLLYKEFSHKLNKLNGRLLNRFKFKSENIMDTILSDELKKDDYIGYRYEGQIRLRNLFNSIDNLTEAEKRYVKNGASVDFVIYDAMDNKPVMFIEVDGFAWHRNNPEQLKKDKMKDSIARKNGIDILRFETGEKSYDEGKIISKIKEKIT